MQTYILTGNRNRESGMGETDSGGRQGNLAMPDDHPFAIYEHVFEVLVLARKA